MATMPDPSMEVPAAPMGDEAEAAPDMAGGYCIELYIGSDGKMSVGVEPKAAEDAEGEGAEETRQPVNTIGDAVRLIREIYNHAGSLQADSAGEDQMAAGYK